MRWELSVHEVEASCSSYPRDPDLQGSERSRDAVERTTVNNNRPQIHKTIQQILLLYLWSKRAVVIGSNRVTWCKLIWGIDQFTGQ